MTTTLIHTGSDIDLIDQLAATSQLCGCPCNQRHPSSLITCSLDTTSPDRDHCPQCGEVDTLDSPAADQALNGYAAAPSTAWRVLTLPEIGQPVDGFLVANANWGGHRRGGRPAAIRTAGYITHVGIVADVHPAAGCPDSWDATTDCQPWGAETDPARPRLAHWCLAEVTQLDEPVRHKIAGWMTSSTCRAIIGQL